LSRGPYLALTPTETVALLGELGYGKRADGLYQLSPDPELRGDCCEGHDVVPLLF
jgi:hypothetical protein